jgi:hypothetical protein
MPDGFIRGFEAKGHAGLTDEGPDIVCAAVSAITQTVIGSLEDLAGLRVDYKLDDGDIRCEVPDPEEMPSGQYLIAKTLMDSCELGCRQISNSYGNEYVTVKEAIYD